MTKSDFRILIIDDVSKNIQVLASVLMKENYKVVFATSGAEALTQIKDNNFDLILLDVMMPQMDGYEVCRRLKSDPGTSEIPIIFLTAKTESEDIVKGFEMGGVDYVTKPFNIKELLARVETQLKIKAATDELKEAYQEIKELNATKDRFFSIIAHDLKNPISLLISISELLMQDMETISQDSLQRFIEGMHNSSKKTYSLLINLLDWARVQTKSAKCVPLKISLYEIILENIDLLIHLAQDKKIALTYELEDYLYAYADRNMIATVVRNLISNAVKFTFEGGKIHVKSFHKNGMIEVEVQDTGMGMEESEQEKLFKIEVHHSTKGTNDEEGTGLGLILCNDFVTLNGGDLRIESKKNEGSKFIFTVPEWDGQSS